MSAQGYPDEGGDHRLLPGLGWLQRLSIFRGAAPEDVESKKLLGWQVKAHLWPPFLLAEKSISEGRFRQARVGWTWRKNQNYYLFGAAFKKETSLLPDYVDSVDKK